MQPVAGRDPELVEYFLARVRGELGATNECNLWTGSRHSHDGCIYGDVGKKGSDRAAHRASWFLFVGDIPADMFVLHKCGYLSRGLCVNPRHLYLGTNADNMRDMIGDLLLRRYRLTPGVLNEVWLEAEWTPMEDLAAKYDLPESVVTRICNDAEYRRTLHLELNVDGMPNREFWRVGTPGCGLWGAGRLARHAGLPPPPCAPIEAFQARIAHEQNHRSPCVHPQWQAFDPHARQKFAQQASEGDSERRRRFTHFVPIPRTKTALASEREPAFPPHPIPNVRVVLDHTVLSPSGENHTTENAGDRATTRYEAELEWLRAIWTPPPYA